MSNVYNTILDLCNSRGISIAKMSKEAGISRSIMTELKSGRTKKPSADTLGKLSIFFNVPSDFFLDLGEISPSDIPPEPEITDSQLLFALYGEVPDKITDEDISDIKKYAAFVRQRKKTENKED